MRFRSRTLAIVLTLGLAFAHDVVRAADPGVTPTEIKIGNTTPYSGPASPYGTGGKTAASYFKKVNDDGGINGRKITCAIEHAQRARPDLVLMDLKMPVLDGWAATQRLKADSATSDIPVIALSAQAMAGDRERALAAGCDGYLPKPLDMRLVIALLRERLR